MGMIRKYLTLEILLRVVADGIMLNAGFAAGLTARAVGLVFFELEPISPPELRGLALESWFIYRRTAPLLTLLGLVIFAASGFYTRGRAYRSRYKVAIIVQAISLTYLLVGFLTYFVSAVTIFPRSAFITGWVISGILLVGARFWATMWVLVVTREARLGPQAPEHDGAKRILVIGGAGYIGSVLCRYLLERGYRVRVLDALLYGDEGIESLYANPNFELMHGDIRDIEVITSAMRDMDAIVHLGEIVGDPATGLDEELAREINIAATHMVAQVARGYGVQRFIYASSCSVYGANDEMLDERSALNPISVYARAKRDAESILLELDDLDFHPTILRFGTVYGLSPRQRFDLVINLLTAKAVVDGEFEIFGGDQWRPFVHVKDVARAVVLVLEAPLENVKRQVFNVGSDAQNYQIKRLGDIVADLIPDTKLTVRETDADKRNYRVSFAKIRQQLGFDPQITIVEGVKEIEDAIRSGSIGYYAERRYSNYKTLSAENGLLVNGQSALTEAIPDLDFRSRGDGWRASSGRPKPWESSFNEVVGELAAISMDNAALIDKPQRSHDFAVQSWLRSLDRHQKEDLGHTQRVTRMAVIIAQEIGLSEAELTHLRRGGLLHDIGLLGIPGAILAKPGPLTEAEWEIMSYHPQLAYQMLIPILNLRASLDIPHCHHERWDGTGYPRGLKRGRIPIAARIFTVADVWDSLRVHKPYRKPWTDEDALQYILASSGSLFDPQVVEAFIKVCPASTSVFAESPIPTSSLH